jgi:hypothetical protein
MAAPVVSGIAALVRTRFPDKAVYSSRFVMGQVVATGTVKQGQVNPKTGSPISYMSSDALLALTDTPKPDLSYLSHFLWDEVQDGTPNDDDGKVDAGERIELAVTIKNVWGQADDVSVTLSAQAQQGEGVSIADPYVTFETATVDYGSTGSFAEDDNGLIYDDDGLLTGVETPFVFTVAANTPNEHIIPMLVTVTATNGLDDTDPTVYEFESDFKLISYSGRELPRVINSDAPGTDGGAIDTDGVVDGVVTIDSSARWIIDNPVLVEEGTTLKIGPGATVQFWGSQSDAAYAVFENAYLQVDGGLVVEGAADNPVTLTPSELFDTRAVVIENNGFVSIKYADLWNPVATKGTSLIPVTPYDLVDHSFISRLRPDQFLYHFKEDDGDWRTQPWGPSLEAYTISNSRLSRLGIEVRGLLYPVALSSTAGGQNNINGDAKFKVDKLTGTLLVDNYLGGEYPPEVSGSVFLNSKQTEFSSSGDAETRGGRMSLSSSQISARATIADVLDYDGKTYVLAWPGHPTLEFPSDKTARAKLYVDRARNFAQSQTGDLAVYSSDAEAEAITAWFGDLNTAVNANDADTLRGQIDICDDRPKVCAKLETTNTKWWSSLVIGAKKTGDTWSWVTNEQPTLLAENDPLSGISADAALASDYLITSVTDAGTSGVRTGTAATTDQVPLVLIELPTQMTLAQVQAAWDAWEDDPSGLPNSAILNPTFNADPDTWLVTSSRGKIDEDDGFDLKGDLTNVYWGEVGESVVDFAVNGYSRDFNKMPLDYTPLATTAPESAYPFVAKLEILDGDGAERADQRFAAEPTVWRVTFNRDMDQTGSAARHLWTRRALYGFHRDR